VLGIFTSYDTGILGGKKIVSINIVLSQSGILRGFFSFSGGFQLFNGRHPFQYFLGFHRPFLVVSTPLVLTDCGPGREADDGIRSAIQGFGCRRIASTFADQSVIRTAGLIPIFTIFTYRCFAHFPPLIHSAVESALSAMAPQINHSNLSGYACIALCIYMH